MSFCSYIAIAFKTMKKRRWIYIDSCVRRCKRCRSILWHPAKDHKHKVFGFYREDNKKWVENSLHSAETIYTNIYIRIYIHIHTNTYYCKCIHCRFIHCQHCLCFTNPRYVLYLLAFISKHFILYMLYSIHIYVGIL